MKNQGSEGVKADNTAVKVGILCFSEKKNYGAKIVAWALQEKVKSLLPEGATVGLIQNINHLENSSFQSDKQSRSLTDWMHSGKCFANEQLKKIRGRVFAGRVDNAAEALRNERFAAFDAQYLQLLGRSNTAEEFRAIASALDAVIIGSDIVFRPDFVKHYPDVYMLGCLAGDNRIRKLSYAAAIATDDREILKPLEQAYAEGMKRYDCLSVREASAQQFLQPLTEKPIVRCCDPVLLFTADEFDFVPHHAEGSYLYANLLDHAKGSRKFLKKAAETKGLPVHFFSNADATAEDGFVSVYSDGPLEFIDRIRSADYVVTNSFHTVLFSLLFHRPFVVLAREDQGLKLRDLLATFGLENRMVSDDTAFDLDTPINWQKVDEKAAALRSTSLDYLRQALA